MKKYTKNLLSGLTVLTLAAACGGGSGGGSKDQEAGTVETSNSQREEVRPDGSNISGFYLARFQTLNAPIVGTIPGSASFTRKDDKLYIYLRLFAGAPKAWHMQAVYTGDRCPTMADDTNGDGTLDINEAMAVTGKVLIPLDSDPGTQAGGRNFYPLGDLSGSYQYERIVGLSRFLNDLQAEDKDPNDNIVKLGPGVGLSLIGKVVMVQGISEDTQLPETVGTEGRRRPFQTIPIACGVFEKVEGTPGQPIGDIPGPVAEVQEGQDRPAPTTPTSTTGGSGSGTTTGGTNESDDGHGPVSDGEGGTLPGRTSGTTGSGSTGSSSTDSSSTTGGSTGSSDSTTGGRSGWWTGRSGSSASTTSTGSTGSSGESSSTGGETGSTTGNSNTETTTTVSSSSSSSTGE